MTLASGIFTLVFALNNGDESL